MRKFFFFLQRFNNRGGRPDVQPDPDIKLSDYLKKLNPASKQSYITLPQSQKPWCRRISRDKGCGGHRPSVVTVGIMKTTQGNGYFEFNPLIRSEG